jgi:tRNA nucleotidyltransferase (CCA-adding enzyme)
MHASTNVSPLLPEYIDLVTARTEFYEHPTALPLTAPSSIKQDLYRRDFTINTLAIRLDPQRWGELLDFYNGYADLEDGIIRVLHSLSFVDDPTRILRAARFEARLDFHIDERSAALIQEALPLLDRVTGARIRHELDLIFMETTPDAALERVQAFGVLSQIHPELGFDDWQATRFGRLRNNFDAQLWRFTDEADQLFLYWGIFLYRYAQDIQQQIADRLVLSRRLQDWFAQKYRTEHILAQNENETKISKIAQLLDACPVDALALEWLVSDRDAVRALIISYIQTWRNVTPSLTGDDLKEMGYRPGPLFREIFAALRAAHLDGVSASREQDIEIVKHQFQRPLRD